MAQEKLTRKLMAKITELQSAPILSLRNGVAVIKSHIIYPAIDGVTFLWHRLSYAELLLIGLVSFIAGPHLKPYAARLLATMRATLLARITALFHVQSARCRLMLGSALASLVSRLNDTAISDKRVLEQRRDAINLCLVWFGRYAQIDSGYHFFRLTTLPLLETGRTTTVV